MNEAIEGSAKLLLAFVAFASLVMNVYQYASNRGRLKLSVGIGHALTKDEAGTYFGLKVAVSNPGRAPIYFSGLKATQIDGDYYFPSFDVVGARKLNPGESLMGHIPAEHILDQKVRDLIALDGVWNEYRVPPKKLRKAIAELTEEADRLKGLGYSLH